MSEVLSVQFIRKPKISLKRSDYFFKIYASFSSLIYLCVRTHMRTRTHTDGGRHNRRPDEKVRRDITIEPS